MAYFKTLPNYPDQRGSLTIIDDAKSKLPFDVERIFCIYHTTDLPRGGHKHYKTQEAVICIQGSFTMTIHEDGEPEKEYILDSPDKCLIVEAREWRVLHSFSTDAVILVLASYHYDPSDYIYQHPKSN
ncbi:MAG TPA: FdtA/QdtA family cupin domain-containing protein [Puia sp.]|nr:FdtA/QdtA family cupin domain-containing protein [Puia sp.]